MSQACTNEQDAFPPRLPDDAEPWVFEPLKLAGPAMTEPGENICMLTITADLFGKYVLEQVEHRGAGKPRSANWVLPDLDTAILETGRRAHIKLLRGYRVLTPSA